MYKGTYLIFDVSYLAYRAFYTFGGLSYGDLGVGVLFGLLRDIVYLQDLHYTNNIIFCFDSKTSRRELIFPDYKGDRKRKERTEEEVEGLRELHKQLKKLRTEYLPEIGFKNILVQKGYEADDLIAAARTAVIRNSGRAVIVGSDKDLLQLLSKRSRIWNPNKRESITRKSFIKQYDIYPWQWPLVLAMAGGHDNIKGVEGVGVITAVRYLRGEIKQDSILHQRILDSKELIEHNLKLVRLPLEGTRPVELVPDKISNTAWRKLTTRLGMKSITKHPRRRKLVDV